MRHLPHPSVEACHGHDLGVEALGVDDAVIEMEENAAVKAKSEGLGRHCLVVSSVRYSGDGSDNKGLDKGECPRLIGALLIFYTSPVHGEKHSVAV